MLAVALGQAMAVDAPRADGSSADVALRRALKESTLRAADLEIEGAREREKAAHQAGGREADAERFRQRAEELAAAAAALRAADLSAYPSPVEEPQAVPAFLEDEGHGPVVPARKVILRVKMRGPCRPGSLLDVEGTSRSGPFFHAAGGALDRLRTGRRHVVTAYLVFRREYFGRMADHYVHVAEVR